MLALKGVNISYFSFHHNSSTKKHLLPQSLKVLYLFLTQALLSIFGRFFVNTEVKKKTKKTKRFKDYTGAVCREGMSDTDHERGRE